MTIRLTIRSALWRSHVAQVVNDVDGLVPVVKGNGYGFGRIELARIAAEFTDTVAVGTVHELVGLPGDLNAIVLTPTLTPPSTTAPVLTVGNAAHIEALSNWPGRVLVKLASSMQRFGRGTELLDDARRAGLDVVGVSIHPPLAGTADDHRREIVELIDGVDPDVAVWVSHVDPATYATLPDTHSYRLRLGTGLWHGDKSFLHLDADVLDVRPVRAGEPAGYRQTPVIDDGHLVMIGAGTRQWRGCARRRPQPVPLPAAPTSTCTSHRTCTRRWHSSPTPIRSRRSATGSTCNVRCTTTVIDEFVWQ